ncbi:MAG: hypothetical protein ACK4XJ_05580 [Fimbriimonadaceae bacterium]
MAQIAGDLWAYNLARVIVVDVSDDYRLMLEPMPSDFYPVLTEVWLPRYKLNSRIPQLSLVQGFLYDWHEAGEGSNGDWYVGVVDSAVSDELIARYPLPDQEA